jgi:hypothetical protein
MCLKRHLILCFNNKKNKTNFWGNIRKEVHVLCPGWKFIFQQTLPFKLKTKYNLKDINEFLLDDPSRVAFASLLYNEVAVICHSIALCPSRGWLSVSTLKPNSPSLSLSLSSLLPSTQREKVDCQLTNNVNK